MAPDDKPHAFKQDLGAKPALSAEFTKGELIGGRYKVISCLGRGGMGVVYEVEQVFLHETLALKTLLSQSASDTSVRRFQLEGRATFGLDHPNLISVSDLGILDDGTPFLVMELIKGETLAEYLRTKGRLQYKDAAKIFARVCLGLAHAHRKGVVHRDIKPSNLMLTGHEFDEEDCVKVMDFGIAKIMRSEEAQALTKTGEVMGSPLYMSPEQCSGTMVDFRSDIYSLGCVFFECLTGAPPFIGDSALSTLTKHLSESAPTLKEASLGIDFPPALEAMVAKMLAKSPDDRYQDLGNLAIDLAEFTKYDTTGARKLIVPPANVVRKKPDATVPIGKKALAALIAAPFLAAAATGAVVYKLCKPVPNLIAVVSPSPPKDTPQLPGDVAGRFSGSERPFSQVAHQNGSAVRIFNFGTDRFGRLSELSTPFVDVSSVPRDDIPLKPNANGDIVVPIHARIRLTLDLAKFLEHPYWINRFAKDDLASLRVESTSDSTPFATDAEQIDYDELMSFLSNLNLLEELDLEKAPISIFGLKQLHIEAFGRLRKLNIGGSNVDGRQLARMAHLLTQLDSLGVNDVSHASELLAVLQHSKRIETLMIQSANLTDSDMDYISHMQNLHVLVMSENKLTERGLEKISVLKQIESLWVPKCPISLSALPTFAKFPHLQALVLPAAFRGHDPELRAVLPKNCQVRISQ